MLFLDIIYSQVDSVNFVSQFKKGKFHDFVIVAFLMKSILQTIWDILNFLYVNDFICN